MAIGAVFGGAHAAGRVWEMGIEGLTAVAFSRDGLLLGIDPFAVSVLRANDHGAGGTNYCQAVVFNSSIQAEHEHVVANNLGIIGGEIARGNPLKFIERDALIRPHGQVAAETTGGPGGVANLAGDG